MHPFMPFITEEIWHQIRERDEKDCIIVASWPQPEKHDKMILDEAQKAFEVISQVRNIRNSKNILAKQHLELHLKGDLRSYRRFLPVITKLAYLKSFVEVNEIEGINLGFVIGKDEFFIPATRGIDVKKEKENITRELDYIRGFLASVEKKLHNERFVQNAPQNVIENERKKQADALVKIKALEVALAEL